MILLSLLILSSSGTRKVFARSRQSTCSGLRFDQHAALHAVIEEQSEGGSGGTGIAFKEQTGLCFTDVRQNFFQVKKRSSQRRGPRKNSLPVSFVLFISQSHPNLADVL